MIQKINYKLKIKTKLNKIFNNPLLSAVFVLLITITIYSCSDDENNVIVPVGPAANTVNGVVTFVDTNFILTGGTYLISAYPSTGWPPMSGPTAFDTISIKRTNNVLDLQYSYTLKDLNPGSYVISVGFRKATGGQSPIMSVYGCDTARAQYSPCFLSPPKNATIGTENQGTEGISMLSWSDTTNKVY